MILQMLSQIDCNLSNLADTAPLKSQANILVLGREHSYYLLFCPGRQITIWQAVKDINMVRLAVNI